MLPSGRVKLVGAVCLRPGTPPRPVAATPPRGEPIAALPRAARGAEPLAATPAASRPPATPATTATMATTPATRATTPAAIYPVSPQQAAFPRGSITDALFDFVDADGDGYITRAELRNAVRADCLGPGQEFQRQRAVAPGAAFVSAAQ